MKEGKINLASCRFLEEEKQQGGGRGTKAVKRTLRSLRRAAVTHRSIHRAASLFPQPRCRLGHYAVKDP